MKVFYKIFLTILLFFIFYIGFVCCKCYIINLYNYLFYSKKVEDASLISLIDEYIIEDTYDDIVSYVINNVKSRKEIINILHNKVLITKNNVYSYINKAQLLTVLITLNDKDNIKNYTDLQNIIVQLSNMDFNNIDEYFSVLNYFIFVLRNKYFENDFLELIAESGIKIINNFINNYYGIGEKENINSFVIDTYKDLYKEYLKILENKYKLDVNTINNINNLSGSELKYFLAKQESIKYNNMSQLTTFVLPIGKIIGKTTAYYTISKIFKNKTISAFATLFGLADVGTDTILLGKKINYTLYADKIHITNRLKALDNRIDINITDMIYNVYICIKNLPVKIYNLFNFFAVDKVSIKYDCKDNKVVNKQILFIKETNIKRAIAKMLVDEVEKTNVLFSNYRKMIFEETKKKEVEIKKQITNIKMNKIQDSISDTIMSVIKKDVKNNNFNYNKIVKMLNNELINFKQQQNEKLQNYREKLDKNMEYIKKRLEENSKLLLSNY
ncbi:MAG: hypothetical protein J6C50_04415 [Rickettsiales bacterium]|nr:hypothetical protein [Rickettsiales bacterium]